MIGVSAVALALSILDRRLRNPGEPSTTLDEKEPHHA
jgi:hypothetical protein